MVLGLSHHWRAVKSDCFSPTALVHCTNLNTSRSSHRLFVVLFFWYLSEVANAGCFSRISRNHFKPIIHLLSPNSSSASEVSILRIVCRKQLNLHIFTTYITSHTWHLSHQRPAWPIRCPSGQARQRALAIGCLVFEVQKGTGRGRLFLLRQLFPGLLGREALGPRVPWKGKTRILVGIYGSSLWLLIIYDVFSQISIFSNIY